MRIALRNIQPSPRPVRTTWDEAKLDELAQSIKEQGVIVPIKVREVGGKYEIVYGHRRVEASRRAGLAEIDALIEDMEDGPALIQALIENIQREDMQPLDVAKSLQTLMDENSWNTGDVERAGIMSRVRSSTALLLLTEPPEIKELIQRGTPGNRAKSSSDVLDDQAEKAPILTPRHIDLTRRTNMDRNERVEVLHKAAQEELSAPQTLRVAEAVKAAPTPELKRRLIETPYSPLIHDPDVVREAAKFPEPPRNKAASAFEWEVRPEVKAIFDALKVLEGKLEDLERGLPEWKRTVDIGKLAPEGVPFFLSRLRRTATKLHSAGRRLEELADWVEKEHRSEMG